MLQLANMNEVSGYQWGVAIGASLVAAMFDIRTRRIPNFLTIPLALTGLVCSVWANGLAGLGDSFLAWIMLALPYILLFAFARGGAGDAKMMGAIGTWLGLEAGTVVLVAVALAGGVFGLLTILLTRSRGFLLRNMAASLYVMMIAVCTGQKGWALLKTEPQETAVPQGERLAIPYGPSIFIGVCIGAWVVHSWT